MTAKTLRAIHCAFWMNSRCYEPKRHAALSETQGRKLESSFCFPQTKAWYCYYFAKRDKEKTEAAVQRPLFKEEQNAERGEGDANQEQRINPGQDKILGPESPGGPEDNPAL